MPRSPRAAEAGEGGVAYRHLAELLELFTERFAAAKERRGGSRLRGPPDPRRRLLERTEIGAAYRARFSHLLVDEFQDTNRLAAAADRGAARAAHRGDVVGDELQSIYGFRHADLEVFREQRRAGRASEPRPRRSS